MSTMSRASSVDVHHGLMGRLHYVVGKVFGHWTLGIDDTLIARLPVGRHR